jgi:dTMP kinase
MNCRFITFEGIDGAGKSTQLAWVTAYLEGKGIVPVVTREPGGTEMGERLREVLLHESGTLHPETEALLMFAARREHIAQVIAPALAAGRVVLCDRFTDASFAYQGGGRGVPAAKLELLERWVQDELQPDLTLYFDLPVALARTRLDGIREPDRFERESQAFYQRVRDAYLLRASAYPDRIMVVDAGKSIVDIQKSLENIFLNICF